MPLTDTAIKAAKPAEKPIKLTDEFAAFNHARKPCSFPVPVKHLALNIVPRRSARASGF